MLDRQMRVLSQGISSVWPRGYKTFFMLNSAEHEIFSANKYENANNSQLLLAFSYLLAEKISCSATFSKKEFAVFSNLWFINKTKFMLSWVEHKIKFYNLRAWTSAFAPVWTGISIHFSPLIRLKYSNYDWTAKTDLLALLYSVNNPRCPIIDEKNSAIQTNL